FSFGLWHVTDHYDRGIGLGRQLLDRVVHPSILCNDPHADERRSPPRSAVMLEDNFVRLGVEINTGLCDDEFLVVPVVEDEFVVEIHAETAVDEPALLDKNVERAGSLWHVVSGPAFGTNSRDWQRGKINRVKIKVGKIERCARDNVLASAGALRSAAELLVLEVFELQTRRAIFRLRLKPRANRRFPQRHQAIGPSDLDLARESIAQAFQRTYRVKGHDFGASAADRNCRIRIGPDQSDGFDLPLV